MLADMQMVRTISLGDHMNLSKSHLPVQTANNRGRCIAFPRTVTVIAPYASRVKHHRSPAVPSPAPRAHHRFGFVAMAALLLLSAGAHAQAVFSTWQNLGTAVTQAVPVTASAAGTVSKVEVLTGGASGLDFTAGTGSVTSACASATLAIGSTCQQSVTFTPAYPGLRRGAVVLLDSGNNVLGTAFLSGVGQGGLDVLVPGNAITVAGRYRTFTSTQDGIQATSANLDQPSSVAFDGAGNMYIADTAHNKVRMVCANTTVTIAGTTCAGAGIISSVAGTGDAGSGGDLGPAKNSGLNAPNGVVLDGAGNLYIADTGNNVIRKVTAATGIITAFAGNGLPGYGGDGLAATNSSVRLNGPVGVTVDGQGNLYIADIANQRIRMVNATTGIITTAAGNGNISGIGDGKGTYSGDGGPAINAGLSLPYAVAFDVNGNMYIPDSANNRIREVKAVSGAITTASTISTVAGSGGAGAGACPNQLAGVAELNTPSGVAVDPAGNIYISDTQDACIRKVNVGTGQMNALALNGDTNISLTGVVGASQLYAPIGIALDGLGNVYYADFYDMIIDEIQSNVAILYYPTPVIEGEQSTTSDLQLVENDGNAPSNLTSVQPGANAAVDPATTTCGPAFPFAMAEDADCDVGAFFAPTTIGDPLLGYVYVAGNTVNDDNPAAPMNIILIGDSVQFSITLTSSPNPSEFGTPANFKATVTAGSGTATGNVVFTDSFNGGATTTLGTIALQGGVATYSNSALAVGSHLVTATYGADASTASVTQAVYEGTKVALTSAPASPSTLGTPVVFTANISGPFGGGQTLSGTVTFTDSLMALPTNTVTVTTTGTTGTASYTANALPQGVNVITAVFTPANPTLVYPPATPTTLNQDVQGASTFTVTSAPNPSIYGSPVTFSVAIPNSGTAAATGKVTIAIVPVGQTTPVYPLTITLAGNPAVGTAAISTLPVGSYNATATYAGDANYAGSTATLASPQVVNQVATTTTAVAVPNPGVAGKPVAITATVAAKSGTVIPTGTVTFADTFNGVTTTLGAGAITLSGTGTATVNPALAAGTHSILISYSGDTNDAASSITLSLVIAEATTTTTVSATPNPATVQATITFTATVTSTGGTPTGTVNFLANGTIALGTGTLSAAGTASVTNATLAAGTYQITAVYGGDANDAVSTSAPISEVVGLLPTTTDLSSATTTGSNAQTILVSTVQNDDVAGPIPTGTVTFKNGTTVIGQAVLSTDGLATLTPNLAAGTYNIVAYYPGDTLHGPSQSPAVSISTLGTGYTITVTPATLNLATTQNTTVAVTLASMSGFTDTVGLGCASLPAGVTCHFANITLPLAANGTAKTQLTIDTNNPLGGGATAMNQQSAKRNVAMAGLLLPISLLMGWILWQFRRRHARVWSMVLILALSGAAMLATGCGGFTQSSAAPGTYTIQVVGVGAASDVTEYQNVTLTITQ